jgi:hypothetical protein
VKPTAEIMSLRAFIDAITKAGRRQPAEEEQHWKAITVAVARVLEGA